MPGAIVAIQTFGDIFHFDPHCHILITDGCFYIKGMIICSVKKGRRGGRKVFDAPKWLAAICSHVPNPGEQMARYH